MMNKINLLGIVVAAGLACGCASTSNVKPPSSCASTCNVSPCPKSTGSQQVLRHVVLFKFKADTTPAQAKQIEDAFRALASKLPLIACFEWGTDVSTEHLSEGFTHCFLVTFRTAADRDAYLPHPEHRAFVAVAKPYLEKALVVDYWAKP